MTGLWLVFILLVVFGLLVPIPVLAYAQEYLRRVAHTGSARLPSVREGLGRGSLRHGYRLWVAVFVANLCANFVTSVPLAALILVVGLLAPSTVGALHWDGLRLILRAIAPLLVSIPWWLIMTRYTLSGSKELLWHWGAAFGDARRDPSYLRAWALTTAPFIALSALGVAVQPSDEFRSLGLTRPLLGPFPTPVAVAFVLAVFCAYVAAVVFAAYVMGRWAWHHSLEPSNATALPAESQPGV